MDKFLPSRCLQGWKASCILLAPLVVSTVISISCIVMTASYFKNIPSQDLELNPQRVCVKCKTLAQRTAGLQMNPVLENVFRKEESKTGRCCVETSNEMSALLELVLSRSQQNGHEDLPTFDPENFTFSQASAHKRLLPFGLQSYRIQALSGLPEFPKEGYVSLVLDTGKTDQEVEHVRNVVVSPWGYHILRSGLYFVYSSLLYEPASNKPCGDFDEQTWEHVIVVGRFGDYQNSGIVARSIHTCCDNCVGIKETSYAGHTIFLNQADHLSVQVSGNGLVRFRKESTFFGLVLIGGKD